MEIPGETWARWHLTDNLAMLARCEEAIDMQKAFLDLGRQRLPAPDWQLPAVWPFDFGYGWRPYRKDALADHAHRIIRLFDRRIVQEAVA